MHQILEVREHRMEVLALVIVPVIVPVIVTADTFLYPHRRSDEFFCVSPMPLSSPIPIAGVLDAQRQEANARERARREAGWSRTSLDIREARLRHV